MKMTNVQFHFLYLFLYSLPQDNIEDMKKTVMLLNVLFDCVQSFEKKRTELEKQATGFHQIFRANDAKINVLNSQIEAGGEDVQKLSNEKIELINSNKKIEKELKDIETHQAGLRDKEVKVEITDEQKKIIVEFMEPNVEVFFGKDPLVESIGGKTDMERFLFIIDKLNGKK